MIKVIAEYTPTDRRTTAVRANRYHKAMNTAASLPYRLLCLTVALAVALIGFSSLSVRYGWRTATITMVAFGCLGVMRAMNALRRCRQQINCHQRD